MLSIKNIYSLFIIFFFYQANAQHNLKLVVQNLSATHLNDTVYVAGNFNGWNPGKTAMAFQQDKNVWEIILSLPTDQYEFKFTLGSWDNVQVTKSGKDAANNSMKLLNDTSIFFTIVAWKNEFEVLPKKHTASNHVTIMDTAFNIPQLNSSKNRRFSDRTRESYDFKVYEPGTLSLADLNPEVRIDDKKDADAEILELQEKLFELQVRYFLEKRRAVFVFEGWDAAGKGGAIKRMTALMDPRGYKVVPIAAPGEDERAHHAQPGIHHERMAGADHERLAGGAHQCLPRLDR